MAILERLVQTIYPGKWEELEKIDQEWTTIEDRHGYPPKTRYAYFSGPYEQGTLVVERLWDNFTVWEDANLKMMDDPETKELYEKTMEIVASNRVEILSKLE